MKEKNKNKYTLTVFHDGQWVPLTDEDLAKFKEECPDVAKFLDSPQEIESLETPNVDEDAQIYDHWEKPAKRIIHNLWKQEGAWLFHYPVDVKAWKIEDYYEIIKTPMDFSTIKMKLSNNEYKAIEDFVKDVNTVFDNCIKYNGESNQYSMVAQKMRKEFETQYANLSMDYYK